MSFSFSDESSPPPDVVTRYQNALSARAPWQTLWQDCYDLTLPELARFTRPTPFIGTSTRAHLYDGTAPDAVDQLAASLLGQLTPPWVNWVGLAPGSDMSGMLADRLVPILAASTRTIQDHIDRSNLHMELHQCFLDLVVGGTACIMITENPVGAATAFSARAVPLSDMVLAEDDRGDLTHVYIPRIVPRATLLAYTETNTPRDLHARLQASDQQEWNIVDYAYPLADGQYVTGRWVDMDDDAPVVLSSRTLSYSPYIVFRWMKVPGDAYGRSPVMKALPDIRTANKVVELILKNASIAATGIWQADDDGVINPANIDLVPGAIIPKAVGSAGLKPLEMPARFDVSQLVLDDLRTRIRHALLADRFPALDPGLRLTATEVRARDDEASLILGAIYGRLQSELLTPLVTRLYTLLKDRGEIADLPLDGRVVQLMHRSPLARVQSERSLRGLMGFIDVVAALGAEARQGLNVPAFTRHIADTLGVPDDLLAPQSLASELIPSTTEGKNHD